MEILGSDGLPVKGFGKTESLMQRFDRTRQVVRWSGRESLGHLQGQVIQLKFTLQQARLYSFRFGPVGGPRG